MSSPGSRKIGIGVAGSPMEWWQPGLQRPWTEASCIASVPAIGATFGSFHNGSCGSPLSVHGSTGIPALEPSQGESGRFPDRHGHGSPSRRLVTPFLRTSLSIVQGRCGAPRKACSSFELALGDANRHVRLEDRFTSGGRCAAIRFNSCLGTVAGLLELDDCSALVGEPNSLLGLAGELVVHRKEHRRCPVITLYLLQRAIDLNSSTFQSLCHCGHAGRLCRVRLARGRSGGGTRRFLPTSGTAAQPRGDRSPRTGVLGHAEVLSNYSFRTTPLLDPADELVAGEGCDVLPGVECHAVGDQCRPQVCRELVYFSTGHSRAAHGITVAGRFEPQHDLSLRAQSSLTSRFRLGRSPCAPSWPRALRRNCRLARS